MSTPSATMTNGNVRHAALTEVRDALDRGEMLTGADIGRRWGRSASWGRSVVSEARRHALVPPDPAPGAPADATDSATAPPVTSAARPESDRWVTAVTILAVLAVAGAAGVASVDHLAVLARLAGVEGWRAWLLPVAIDGLGVAAAMTLYRAHRAAEAAGILPWAALGAGVVGSLIGNILAVHPDLVDVGTLRIIVGATPPISLTLAVELGIRQLRHTA